MAATDRSGGQAPGRVRFGLAAPDPEAGARDRDGEVDVLAAAGDDDAHDAAVARESRPARVAGVRGGIGLDPAATRAADDAGRDRALQPEGAPDEEQLVACTGTR